MKLWELLHSVPLTGETPDLDMEINSISYDTRTLEPGALFAALPGARDDGARYIREALDRGAAAVLCRERLSAPGSRPECPHRIYLSHRPHTRRFPTPFPVFLRSLDIRQPRS